MNFFPSVFKLQYSLFLSESDIIPSAIFFYSSCISHVSVCSCFSVTLTDVVVALSLAELLAQRERCEALELLRELLRSVGGERSGALPAQLIERVRLADLVVLQVHHVEDVALCLLGRDLTALVVRTDDVQVVIDVHVHSVFVTDKAGEERERGGGEKGDE